MLTRCIAGIALLMMISTPAEAQDAGRIGVTLAVPTALGVIWHATDRWAIRPELNFSTSHSSSSQSQLAFNGHSWEVAVNAPYYLSSTDNVHTYLSPRIGYSRSTSEVVITPPIPSSTLTELELAGSFGAQYAPVRRFNIFGETGISFRHSESSSGGISGLSRSAWGLRSSVGVILYLGR